MRRGTLSVAVALTEEGERRGYEVWAATQGFRSLTKDATSNPPFERLIVSRKERYNSAGAGDPGAVDGAARARRRE